MKKLRRTWQPPSAFLPRESSRTEEPGRLQSTGLQRVGHWGTTKHSTAQGDNTYLHKIPGSSGSHHCHCKENGGPVIPSSSPDHSSGESWTRPCFRGLPSLRGIPGKQWERGRGQTSGFLLQQGRGSSTPQEPLLWKLPKPEGNSKGRGGLQEQYPGDPLCPWRWNFWVLTANDAQGQGASCYSVLKQLPHWENQPHF